MFILFLCIWINQLFCRKRNINSALYWEAEWCFLAAIQIYVYFVEQLLCVPMINVIYLDTFAFFYFFLIGLTASLKAAH